MATWSVTLNPGGDITALVDVMSIKRQERLFSELRPNVNRCDFRIIFDATLFQTLITNDPILCTITKDGSAYFTGTLSPNYTAQIKAGRKYIAMIAEDFSLLKLDQPIMSVLAYSGYQVCAPLFTYVSLVHALTTAAGVTLAASPPTITSTVPYLVVLPDDKTTYAQVLSDLLFEYGYVYYFNPDGTMSIIPSVNTGTVTYSTTFDVSLTGGNARGEILATKRPERYDDIRVKYDEVELRSNLVIFEDTSGATGSQSCNIELAATGDPDGLDYYPKNSGTVEVFSEYQSPEGYTIKAAYGALLDAEYESGIVESTPFTNYYRRGSFSLHNTAAAAKKITKLRITGPAYIVAAQSIARLDVASGKKQLEYTCKYLTSTPDAQALARRLTQYYRYSDHTYMVQSQEDVAVGDYVLLYDNVFSGISQKCRVIGKLEDTQTKSKTYELEAVADFVSASLVDEGINIPANTSAMDQILAMADDSIISPQEKSTIALRWEDINGDGVSTGSYWGTRNQAVLSNTPTENLDAAREELAAQLYTDPGVLLKDTWGENILVDPIEFYKTWSDYYKAEADTLANISYYASFGSVQIFDCGEWSADDPITDDVYQMGEYVVSNDEDTSIDYDMDTWSAIPEDSTLDCGAWSTDPAVESLDMGVYKVPDAIFILPTIFVDCGSFDN